MKFFDREQFVGGPAGWLVAFTAAYVIMTLVTWRTREDIDVKEFHQKQHMPLLQYVESQGEYIRECVEQIWK